ncbi:hypothetical protein OC846_006082 [Tilletia horrida]|uniref:OPT family small oligopeptide transporter n=1 Tax=Tilletia horrida TaxID=155126 RepID=A0AAN6GKJ3_9BASI|nr:hypothetical protein OC846_006082 [Tilletia horrida]KAK0564601.1 hypothetical protein OC861_004191 [Tilletia horrida]
MSQVHPDLESPSVEKDSTSDHNSISESGKQHDIEADLQNNIVSRKLNDPNLDPALIDAAEDAIQHHDIKTELQLEDALQDDSIYPEVRASVSNVDDPSMPINTFRTWFIGLLSSILLSGLNEFFSYRYPSVSISALVAQVVIFPVGVFLAKVLPTRSFTTPLGSFTLNPGPFNIKEHTLITIMANVSSGGAYATYDIGAQQFYYGQKWGAGYRILLVLSSQLIGFSYAGFCRRWLVWPASMIWPGNLVQTALLTTFHHQKGVQPGKITRERYFLYLFLGAFCYYWFPGYIFTALSAFNWACWIAPNNVKVNQLMGTQSGLGMGLLSLDWSQISYVVAPMVTPWFTTVQVLTSFVFWMWFIAPILYYNNVKNTAYLPLLTNHVYDNTGNVYSTKTVFTADGKFNATAYNEYSQQFLPVTTMLSFGLQFASVASVFSHVFMYFRHDLARQWKASLKQEADIHARLMSRYKEVPNSWYLAVFVVSFVLALATILAWPTNMPWWALVVALLISAVFTLPCGIVTAITNLQVGLNVPSELIIGYMLPGRPVAMMIFKTFGYVASAQGISFLSDAKLGHYMKIPPRTMFMAQMIATSVAAIVVIGVQAWVFGNIKDVCTKHAQDGFQCPGVTTYGSSSIIWGLIGPGLNFSSGQPYNFLLYFFLIGFLIPVPTYFLAKRFPQSILRYVYWPVLFIAASSTAPATGTNFVMGAAVGWVFQSYLRRRHTGWWSSYNYITQAGLDVGTGIATVLIFFTVVYPKGKNQAFSEGNWWGNTVQYNNLDANEVAYLPIPDSGVFAPAPGGTSPRRSIDNHDEDGGAGDLGVSIPAPHMLEGSSYPAITSPSSYAGSSNGGRSSRARARNSLPTSLLPQPSPSPHPGIGTYSLQQQPQPQPHFAHGPPSDLTSSSRRTRRSLPPPQSYAYAASPPPHPIDYHQAGYGNSAAAGGGGYGQDPYAMPEYLYSPQPHSSGSLAPPSVSSGASATSTHRTRHDGIFAVAAPHHSQARGPRSSYPSHSSIQLQQQQQQLQQQMYQHSQQSGQGMAVGDVLPSFPPWSMAWYAGHVSADGHAYTMVPPNGSGAGDWESDTLTSAGYPAYPHHYRPYPVPPGAYPYGPHPPASARSSLARDAPQAAAADPEAQAAALKAARLRALEREFGLKVDGHPAGHDDDDDDFDDDALGLLGERGMDDDEKGDGDDDENEDALLPPGSVTSDGRFVHNHPKMRTAVGWALLLLAVFTFAIGAGGSYLIKIADPILPSSAPAKGTLGSYALYVLSFFCVGISFYLVCVRPCCVEPVRRRRVAGMVGGGGGPMGMPGGLVVPVLTNGGGGGGGGLFGGSKSKMPKGMPMPMPPGGGRRGLFGRKKGPGMMGGPAPTVNLIVDPRAMMGGAGGLGGDLGSDDDDDSSDDEETQAEKRALAARPENADLAGLLGRSTAAAIGAPAGATAAPLTKKQRRRQRRAARLRRRDLAARRAAFVPLVLASLRTQAVWLCVQSLMWLLAVFACLIPLFRSTASTSVSFTDAGTGETLNRTLQYNRTALGAACLPRGGGGWCDAYNGARAGSVISLVVCLLLAGWAMRELSLAKTLARREGAGFRVR